jgi:carboxypeptidase C (cathepsin A)
MRYTRNLQILLAIVLGSAVSAWGQGGRAGRGAAAAQAGAQTGAPPAGAPANAAGRGGRGAGGAPAAAGGAGGASDFYEYDTTAGAGKAISDGPPAETHQKITLNGTALAYTTRAGYMPLHNATTGQTEAHIFYTAYLKDGVSDAASRPIVFFLGGAPGVSASWQEFGGLGPKRMKEGSSAGVENPNTLLGYADLVFVNPVGTAYSRAETPSRGPSFWNTAADIASLGDFVRSYVALSDRRTSPLFLAGEDFGTGRAAGLAAYLIERNVPVHGVALLSLTPSADALAGDAQYINLLPSLVMAAWSHKKLTPELNAMSSEQIAGQARQFAARQYLHALYKGDRMTAEERTKVIAELARLTGLSKQFLVSNNLRVSLDRFSSELLHEQHHTMARSDARVAGFAPAPAGGGRGGGGGGFGIAAPPPIDLNIANLSASFLTVYDSYLRKELSFNGGDAVFYLNSGGVNGFTSTGNDDANLASAFARNPKLRLFVAENYFDLNLPFYATDYTLAHLSVSPEVRAHNISVSQYESGQMTYGDDKSLMKLQKDLASFLGGAAQK